MSKQGCLLLVLWVVGTVLACIGTYYCYQHNHSRDFAVWSVLVLAIGLLVVVWIMSVWNRRLR